MAGVWAELACDWHLMDRGLTGAAPVAASQQLGQTQMFVLLSSFQILP